VTSEWKNPSVDSSGNHDAVAVFTGHESPVTNHIAAIDLGLVGYTDACALQQRAVAARKAGAMGDVLLLCQHPHVITLGRNAKREHLLASDHVLQQKGVAVHSSRRGGDVTYHGPGQIVAYPILDLAAIRRDVGWYVRMLEEVMIRASADYGIAAVREPGKTGVWVAPKETPTAEKLGAIGVHLSRWVTSHGFAYNVSTDLRYFELIVPCGIAGRKATSLERVLSRSVDVREAAARLTKHFGDVFSCKMESSSREDLLQKLAESQEAVAASA
jgi:lipoyl(octanoyl) transferase